jgi:hypothetical protein
MSKSIGQFNIITSEEALVDKALLAKALNCFSWATTDMFFTFCNQNNVLKLTDDGWCDEPTVFPERIISLEIYDPKEINQIKEIPPEEATPIDLENIEDHTYASAGLEDICKKISPAIKSGYILLSCTANHTSSMYVYQQTLKIYKDGSGSQDYTFINFNDPERTTHKFFEYKPQ